MRPVSSVLATTAFAFAPVLAISEYADSVSTIASASNRLRVLFEPDQLPCHISGVAACVDGLQKTFFACDPKDIDCQCGALIQLELSCYGICPQSVSRLDFVYSSQSESLSANIIQQLLLEIATSINEVCSKLAVGAQNDQETDFLEDDDDTVVVDFDDDNGSLVIEDLATEEIGPDSGDDGYLVVEDLAAEEPAVAEEPSITEEPTADEEVADEEPADEEVADEESADEEVADEESADEEVADEESADEEVADEESADEEVADEESADAEGPVAAEEPSAGDSPAATGNDPVAVSEEEPLGLYDVSEDTTYGVAVSEETGIYIPYFATAAPMTTTVPVTESTFAPVAVPEPAALSPTATPVAEFRIPAEAFNRAAAASITSIPVFVPVHTVLTDTDNTITVTYPRFQGYTPADATLTTSPSVATTAVPMALGANSTAEDSAAVYANYSNQYSYQSNSSGVYSYAHNYSDSGYYRNNSSYGNVTGNYNTTFTIYDSSSRNIGVTATIVIGAAIGVAFALF
ncbi:hypothetical protein V1522DRAFT_444415 [Lipomyces starkeyi]